MDATKKTGSERPADSARVAAVCADRRKPAEDRRAAASVVPFRRPPAADRRRPDDDPGPQAA